MFTVGSRAPRSARHVAGLAALCACLCALALTPGTASASRSCGSFAVPGLLTRVHVHVSYGSATCSRARTVMRGLFASRRYVTPPWKCVGPQTGYAACTKPHNKIVASF
jgi:hypothetical protein